jgi:long-chain acyl-CoA synthetase
VGKVLQGTEMMIDQPNEHGEGEVCVRSPGVMLGYYKDEEATREVIWDGWFHTGDIGYIDEDDYVYLSGRIKNLIILANGENVSPEEIELRLIDHPAIQELVVYAKGDRIAAQIYVSPDAQEENPQEEIRRFIEQYNDSAPSFKQISVVEFRNSPFERTASQKILRNSLQ